MEATAWIDYFGSWMRLYNIPTNKEILVYKNRIVYFYVSNVKEGLRLYNKIANHR